MSLPNSGVVPGGKNGLAMPSIYALRAFRWMDMRQAAPRGG